MGFCGRPITFLLGEGGRAQCGPQVRVENLVIFVSALQRQETHMLLCFCYLVPPTTGMWPLGILCMTECGPRFLSPSLRPHLHSLLGMGSGLHQLHPPCAFIAM